MIKKIFFVTLGFCYLLNSKAQITYTFSYDSHGNRTGLACKKNNPSGGEMDSEELAKHFKLHSVAKNFIFLQFVDIDNNNIQWVYVYDPNGRLYLIPEILDSGCPINLQNATNKGIYVLSFCYNNFVYSYKLFVN